MNTFVTKYALVKVLGCKVNQFETAAMIDSLKSAGYVVNDAENAPDLILVHTCAVTGKAEGKSRRLINRLAELHPDAFLIITGCLTEVNSSILGDRNHRAIVLGNFEKNDFNKYLSELAPGVYRRGAEHCTQFADSSARPIPGRARQYLKIQDGCSQKCAYCIVPFTRGPSRSLEARRVFSNCGELIDYGCREIVLTGIHIGMYGKDLTPTIELPELLNQLVKAYPDCKFRISSIEPQEITPDFINVMQMNNNICRHLHIPLQSGDDQILQLMGRPYDTRKVKQTVDEIREKLPDVCLGFDILVGFPGEDENSFAITAQFVESLNPAYLHVFPFSSRPGTRAAELHDKVSPQMKNERTAFLREQSAKYRNAFYKRFIGWTLPAVIESLCDKEKEIIVRTDNYIPVRALRNGHPDNAPVVRVILDAFIGNEVFGRIIQDQ